MIAPASRPIPRDPLWLRLLLWTCIAAYLLFFGIWAFQAGMRMRDDTWDFSRTIHFQTDISNAWRWGSMVLRTGEKLANLREHQRPLTVSEMIRGEGKVYDDLVVNNPPDGDYELDYPPLRLFANALWVRDVQSRLPALESWPGAWTLQYSEKGIPADLATEDIGRPLLLINTAAVAAAALLAFALVWLWSHRGGRPRAPGSNKRLVPWRPIPLRNINGLLLFSIAAAAFFYAMVIAESPCPPPPPIITFAGRPILQKSPAATSAIINTVIDGGGSDTQWYVEWGTTILYGHRSVSQSAADDVNSVSLTDLPKAAMLHYRATATSDRGVTHTDDATLNTAASLAPMPPSGDFGAVWLSWPQWLGIAVLFIAMTGSLCVMPPVHRAWGAALLAALFMWFDPSILVDGHVYPQWDEWLLPVFLAAALLTSLDCWFLAGIVLGAGFMFKGQLLIAGPILAIWPLCAGRWGALLRLVVAFLLTAGLILSPWAVMANRPPDWSFGALRWIGGVFCAALIALALSLYRRPVQRRAVELWRELKARAPAPAKTNLYDPIIFGLSLLASIVIITLLILRHWPVDWDAPSRMIGLALLLFILLPPWFLRRRSLPLWFAAIAAASIWISAFLFHGDWSWKTIGFDYGTRKHTMMALGANTIGSLPRILEGRFGWDIHDIAMTLHPPPLGSWLSSIGIGAAPITLDIRALLITVFAITMLLSGMGATIQSKRNHPRFLAALAAVWVLMPNVLTQMAGRYQMWGAAMTCLLVGIAPGLTILHIVLSLLAAGMIGGQLLEHDPSRAPQLVDLVTRLAPDDGLITLTIAVIVLYFALAPGRRPTKEELLLP